MLAFFVRERGRFFYFYLLPPVGPSFLSCRAWIVNSPCSHSQGQRRAQFPLFLVTDICSPDYIIRKSWPTQLSLNSRQSRVRTGLQGREQIKWHFPNSMPTLTSSKCIFLVWTSNCYLFTCHLLSDV